MKSARALFLTSLLAVLAAPLACPVTASAADAAVVQPKEGWYPKVVDTDFVRSQVDIPPKKDVVIIDSRPAARRYDVGHIPGAIDIPDTAFDKMTDRLPADKGALLIFYCGGFDCMLSHNSAFKAEKLGYTNIRVYAAGEPDWTARGLPLSVSAAHIKRLIDEKASYMLIDARPRRTAEKGMIPTSVNISDTEFDKNLDKLPADKATPLIYYCGGLECVLSDKSAEKARKLGYTNVKTYPEGYPEWTRLYGAAPVAAAPASQPDTGKASTVALAPGKEKGSVTVASFQQLWKENPTAILLIDVRDAKEFASGTIQGAMNLPINELEKKIDSLPKDRPIVFLCGTGARAGEAHDMAKLYRSELRTFFLNADIKWSKDGTYTMVEK